MVAMRIRLDSRVRIALSDLPPIALFDLQEAFTHPNPAYRQLIRLKKLYAAQQLPKVITTFEITNDEVTFPRGGFKRVRSVLQQHKITTFEVFDERVEGEELLWLPDSGQTLDWFQAEAIALAEQSQNCLIRAPTGSGKTTAAISLISKLKRPSLILVWTEGLRAQWVKRLRAELGLDNDQVGEWGGGIKEEADLLVAMDQTLAKGIPDWMKSKFGVLICDEVQRFAAKSFRAVVDQFPAKYRIGLSADETRTDELECLIYDQFGSVSYEISQEAVDATGRTVPVDIVMVPTNLRVEGKTVHERTKAMEENQTRNELIFSLLKLNKGKQVLLVAPRVEHCRKLDVELIRRGYRSGLVIGGADNKAEYKRTVDGLIDGKIDVSVGTVEAIGTGIDIPTLEVAIVADPIAMNLQLLNQVRGRICRGNVKGKEKGVLYYLWDQYIYGRRALAGLTEKYPDKVKIYSEYGLSEPVAYRIPRTNSLFDGIVLGCIIATSTRLGVLGQEHETPSLPRVATDSIKG